MKETAELKEKPTCIIFDLPKSIRKRTKLKYTYLCLKFEKAKSRRLKISKKYVLLVNNVIHDLLNCSSIGT